MTRQFDRKRLARLGDVLCGLGLLEWEDEPQVIGQRACTREPPAAAW